jgi:hypothetical protein
MAAKENKEVADPQMDRWSSHSTTKSTIKYLQMKKTFVPKQKDLVKWLTSKLQRVGTVNLVADTINGKNRNVNVA